MNQPATEIKRQQLLLLFIYIAFIAITLAIQLSNGLEWASLHVHYARQGQLWRLVTGHLTHLDWNHWTMNMIGLTLCLLVFRRDLHPGHWVASFMFVSIFSSLCLLVTYADNQRYVGFSDVLHGWILIGAAAISVKEPKLAITIFVLFWLKVIEENSGLVFFTSATIHGNIATESHIYGALGGTLYAVIFLPQMREHISRIRNRLQKKT